MQMKISEKRKQHHAKRTPQCEIGEGGEA